MKEQDLMRALGNLPQDMLEEFEEWQANGTPLTGDAETEEPCIRETKTTMQRNSGAAKTRPWTIGICAAMAACLIMAVSVGKEAIGGKSDLMRAGYSAGESDAVQEMAEISHDNFDEIRINCMETAVKQNSEDAPYSLSAQIIRTPEQAQPVIDMLTPEDPADNSAERLLSLLDADALASQDVIFFGIPEDQFAGSAYGAEVSCRCMEITRDGMLTFDAVCMQHIAPEQTDRAKEFISYYGVAVEKNVVPDLTGFALRTSKFRSEYLPDGIREQEAGWDEKLRDYREKYEDEWKAYRARCEEQEGFKLWLEKEPVVPENAVEVTEQQVEAPFYAWYWVHYAGNDIEVPAGGRLEVLHNADEAAAFLTQSGQQPEDMTYFLSREWFTGDIAPSMEEDAACEPHDVLFVGIPKSEMPENVVSWSFCDASVTPSGKLHLVCNVLTGSSPEYLTDADAENFYFFLSVPQGRLPEITEWSVTFDDYHTDAQPDASVQNGEKDYKEWVWEQGTAQSYMAASVCDKYIYPVPEVQPGIVTVQGSQIRYWPGAETVAGASLLTGTDADQAWGIDWKTTSIEGVDLSKYDMIEIALPTEYANAAYSLTDMKISADGVLSLTCNISRDTQEQAETGAMIFRLLMPNDSVPNITGIQVQNEVFEQADDPNENDEYPFLQKASRMMTIQVEK